MSDIKQMNTFFAIIIAWLISIVICSIIGVYWFPPFINYPLNHSIPFAYLLYPLCKNNFNYKIAYPSMSFFAKRVLVAFIILMIFNSIHPFAEQIRMNNITYK